MPTLRFKTRAEFNEWARDYNPEFAKALDAATEKKTKGVPAPLESPLAKKITKYCRNEGLPHQ